MESIREKRIRKITQLYYSRPEVQKAIYEFSKNREISPRYFEGFGKRPDSFQFKGDIFSLVKKGATSFHASEELWKNPLEIETGMDEKASNELRIGWDLLIDIDCKWFDYSKLAAKAIIKVLNNHGVKNVGIKFSGSKGWHILVPWEAFPKEVSGIATKNLFPELPRKVIAYLRAKSRDEMEKLLPKDFEKQFKKIEIKKGVKCRNCGEIAGQFHEVEYYCKFCRQGEIRKTKENLKLKCAECGRELEEVSKIEVLECAKCNIDSKKNPDKFTEFSQTDLFELMGLDLVLVSPRHLFRMPYSLHEKTSLASVVINEEEIEDFEFKNADPMSVKVREFSPEAKENEAEELVLRSLDWSKASGFDKEIEKKAEGKYANFKPIELKNLEESEFPPCVKKILEGVKDGRKRALFVLINFFRSIGVEKEILEKKIQDWNEKNEVPLKKGYINSQLVWSYRRKPILPQNCREFYLSLGVCSPDKTCSSIKNPVNYTVRRNYAKNNLKKEKPKKKKSK